MCTLGDFDSIELDDVHRSLVQTELEMWHEQYLPCGKKILDIGAGCGETALFYFKHGAEKVVCVEIQKPYGYCTATSTTNPAS